VTGTLEKFTREEAQEQLKLKGYKVTSSLSKKTDLLVAGKNPGSKLDKANALGIKVIDEQGLLDILKLMIDNAEKYMQLAINLAKRGIGSVEPNPAVGAIITKSNQIIGQGWHKKFGEAHAEINALKDCESLAISPKGATMYVTLEPCCHQGKTGPCTKAIIEAGISRFL
jgi:hypothetical protein